jgi:hypothetical protein
MIASAESAPRHGPPPESLFKMSVCNDPNMTLICPNLNCYNEKKKHKRVHHNWFLNKKSIFVLKYIKFIIGYTN